MANKKWPDTTFSFWRFPILGMLFKTDQDILSIENSIPAKVLKISFEVNNRHYTLSNVFSLLDSVSPAVFEIKFSD